MLTCINPGHAQVLPKAGFTVEEIDAFEVNEAFASVVLAWRKEGLCALWMNASRNRTEVSYSGIH